jgi:ankyrin repeat protein
MTWTRLHDACQHRDNKMIVKLAQSFAEEAVMMDDRCSTPLHIACWGNPPIEVIRTLLHACPQAATDKDILGNTPLHVAASCPETNPAIIRALLEICPTASSVSNKEGLTALHMACRHAPTNELVIALLVDSYPYALRTRTKMGQLVVSKKQNTEKHETHHFVTDLAGKSNLESSDALHGALDQQVRDGSYPLHMAIAAGAPRNVVDLILGEADDDVLLMVNKHGETSLHIALANPSNEEFVDLLIETSKKCELTRIKDKRHNLPIHTAATFGCSVGVAKKLLLIYPNSIHKKNKESKTPLDLATEYGRCSEEVIRLFEISDHSETSLE